MQLRQLVATITIGATSIVGLQVAAGAADSTFTVSDTTIPAGGTVTVTLTTPCLHPDGLPEYGNVIQSKVGDPNTSDNQETKGNRFDKGDTGVFTFPTPGTYTLTRFCDTPGMLDQVTIVVTAPTPPTTAAPTTAAPTTAAPATTTSAPRATTTVPGATTTTAKVTTTTVATSVAGISSTNTAGSSGTKAPAATRVQSGVSYTG